MVSRVNKLRFASEGVNRVVCQSDGTRRFRQRIERAVGIAADLADRFHAHLIGVAGWYRR